MNPYWVTYAAGGGLSIDADDEQEARNIGQQYGTIESVKILPYPSTPRINKRTSCPSFCHRPKKCAGYTSCPNSPACSE